MMRICVGIAIVVCVVFQYISGGVVFAQTSVFDLEEVVVSADVPEDEDTNRIINQKTLKSHKIVDLAEILSDEMIESSMVRKSGYGNEVGLRGFTKSNLRFTLDDTLVEGSCGSRKDPPLSHINLLTVQKIEVREGPYDVSVPGALGGDINVISKDTQKDFHGEVLSKFGAFGYLSQGGYVTGGSHAFQGLFGYNYSKSGQYEDGGGNKLSSFNPAYNSEGKNLDAFEKNDFWGKVTVNPAENQKLLFSSSFGEACDIVTPRVAMDTEKEKTYLNKLEYAFDNLGSISKQLKISAYYNRIEHYPYGKYRTGSVNNKRIEAISSISGMQLENTTPADVALFTYGTDFYQRNWYGNVLNRNTGAMLNDELFPDVDEQNIGAYLQAEQDYDKLYVNSGLRADVFRSKAGEDLKYSKAMTNENAQTDILPGANVFLKYFLQDDANLFGGVGLSNRMPTTVERYVQEGTGYYGNPELKPSRNLEADFGFEKRFLDHLKFKTKVFYSYLDDFIYQQNSGGVKTYTNIDAYLYGGDATTTIDLMHGFSVEGGVAWQRGRKIDQPAGNSDKDLAEICPLKTKLALNYDYDKRGFFAVCEWVHSEKNENIDYDAGETLLGDWDVFNVRGGYLFGNQAGNLSFLNGLSVFFGVNNIFDQEYAVANSYEYDPTDPGGENAKIVNEPGRQIYASMSYRF